MKREILLTIVLGLLLVSTAVAVEPGDTLWTKVYGGQYNESAFSVQQTTDGGYVVAGYSYTFGPGNYDVYLLKTDANGDTSWTRTYGGTDGDYGYSVQQTTDGGYVIAGNTESFGGVSNDMFLVKTDGDGDTLWTRTYDGPGGYELAYYVQQTTDGGYIIAGYTFFLGSTDRDVFLVKTDADGDTLWTRSYGGSAADIARSAQQTSDGGYIVAGETESFGTGGDMYVLKTDANGDTLWTRTYGGNHLDNARYVQEITEGGYIIAGETDSYGVGGDACLLKIDADGNPLWLRTYGGRDDDHALGAHQTADGGYILVGYTWMGGNSWFDAYIVRTDANGDTLWIRTYGGAQDEHAHFVRQTDDGGYIVAAATRSFGAGAGDVWLMRLAGEEPGPDLSIEIIPDDPPVTVPQGGRFGYTGSLTNNTSELQVTDVWTMAIGPQEGIYGPFKEFYDLQLDAYESRSAHFNQRVSNSAPLGLYNYIVYCGDYPSTVADSSFFEVEVIAGPAGGGSWVLTGSFDKSAESLIAPFGFCLLENYPNPFNASTVISYELPTTAHVKLEVYNLFGQKVATLVNGKQQAGYRSVTWDASKVSSGFYFYKLTAGDFRETRRMLLVK